MKIEKTPLDGLLVLIPHIFTDQRGYFLETWNKNEFDREFVQDNEAKSNKGVLRGLHYQKKPYEQAKLVRVVKGAVWDVAVDMRENSDSYLNWYGVKLSGENKKQLYIPRGFAHGYLVLTDEAIFSYKCDNFYHQQSESGLRYNDPSIGIQWPDIGMEFRLSEKDKNWGYIR